MKGKVTQWNDGKGFGFIVSEDGGEKLFFHISTVKTQARRPKTGDVVLYESMRDSKGRLKAKAVVIENPGAPSRPDSDNRPIRTEPPKKSLVDYLAMIFLAGSISGAVFTFIKTGNIENAIPFAVATAVAIILLNRQKKPKEKKFTCARCKKASLHDKRTIRAWNDGLVKLYCSACHQTWLANRPSQIQHRPFSNRGSGCLGVAVLLAIVPIMICAWV